ncbi:TetR/AcrR family transcriptional regulator [Streptomyces sp. NBC_01429]|uniref:TetR/AcrR family transcriptional regulator n=1 Tax=Streptomyces sp. NBC_01429 TaxID=2903862 RepID=UPI002E2A2053|nr:TetR/AcrR family transcriptional regulator [Streptomyces sp. NBC_01429]
MSTRSPPRSPVSASASGTLYRRFPTKDALITELVRELVGELMTEAQAALDVPDGRGPERFLFAAGQIQADARGCLGRIWSDDATAGYGRSTAKRSTSSSATPSARAASAPTPP